MIVVDTSALIAIVLDEAQAVVCGAALARADAVLISATTLAETLIVADRKGVGEELAILVDSLRMEVVAVTSESARRTAEIYSRWGKGVHPAALNFADCFAYELAAWNNCPLLFIGDEFSRTDIQPAL